VANQHPLEKRFLQKIALLNQQFQWRDGMAAVRPLKVLLATCPRALLRSTLTARTSAKTAPLEIACRELVLSREKGKT